MKQARHGSARGMLQDSHPQFGVKSGLFPQVCCGQWTMVCSASSVDVAKFESRQVQTSFSPMRRFFHEANHGFYSRHPYVLCLSARRTKPGQDHIGSIAGKWFSRADGRYPTFVSAAPFRLQAGADRSGRPNVMSCNEEFFADSEFALIVVSDRKLPKATHDPAR